MREMIQETLTPCAGYLAHPFVENDRFFERMCQVASTARGRAFSEPEITIRSCGNTHQITLGSLKRGKRKLGDYASRAHPPNGITIPFSEPEIAIRSCGNIHGMSSSLWQTELGNVTSRAHPPNSIARPLSEPEIAIRSCGNTIQATLRGRKRKLGNGTGRGNPPDFITGEGVLFSEPEIAIRSLRDSN